MKGRLLTVGKEHGRECWYCGLDDYDASDRYLRCTLEHLMNRDHPQANDLQNLRLAHAICNNFASNHTFPNKLQIRYLMREDITVRGRLMTKAGGKNLRRNYGIDSRTRKRVGLRVRKSYRRPKSGKRT